MNDKPVEEIAPQFYIIRTPLSSDCYVASFVLMSHKNAVIIDTGLKETAIHIRHLLDRLGIGAKQVNAIINTHSHHDHIGSNAELKEYYQCPVIAHCFAVAWIENHQKQYTEFLERYKSIFPPDDSIRNAFFENLGKAASVDDTFNDLVAFQVGERHLNLIHTPGHSKDSTIVFEAGTGTLIAGDSLMGRGVGRALPQYENLASYRDSLLRIAHLRPQKLYTAHFEPFLNDAVETFINASFQITLEIDRVLSNIYSTGESFKLLDLTRELCRKMNAEPAIQTLYTVEAHVKEKKHWSLK